jgi:hypothetical protein
MDETDDSDTLLVNCGRCGESFIVIQMKGPSLAPAG